MPTFTVTTTLDGHALNEAGRLIGLRWDPGATTIGLRDRMLIEDDADAIGRPEGAEEGSWFERLTPGLRIRKELVLSDARCHGAQLTWCGREPDDNSVPLQLSVNGFAITRPATKHAHPQCRHYYTSDWASSTFDNWFVVALPPDALREGTNTIEMWVDEASDGVWEIMIAADSERPRGAAPPRPPVGRSARSRDAGATWSRSGLGQFDRIDGEYCVRLNVQQHAAVGRFLSAPIDLSGSEGIAHCRVVRSAVDWNIDGPGQVDIQVRFGESPVEEGDGWSSWVSADDAAGEWSHPRGRWMQFAATMSTKDPRVSPCLRGLRIVSEIETGASPQRPRLVRLHNGEVTRSSVAYTWEDPERLQDLRSRFDLDCVVKGATTEFERMLRLLHWSYRIPLGQLNPYGWRYDDLPQLESEADGSIRLLGPYDGPRRQGHCLYCNLTLIAALLSFGYPARWVNISTKHTYGHEVTEVWSNDFDKWVFLDATRDYYMTDPETGMPLSLSEIGERVAEILPRPVTWDQPIPHLLPSGVSPDNVRIAYRTPPHGGSVFADGADHDLLMIGHLQMPLRNDFVTRPQPVPWRVSSNWGSGEFYCWSSPMFPPKLEYDHHTDRWQDWEPPLNRTRLVLSETQKPAILQVDADTVTPWSDGFEVCFEEDPWTHRQVVRWEWPLHEGQNRMRVRSKNRMGVTGPESEAVVWWTNGPGPVRPEG
ncbi:MAG: hypothetical protein VX733_06940 [Candidatus Latescibacterota bacterium]|nr:hypothetical protein [Candidatus Latescibacterota bacterium]